MRLALFRVGVAAGIAMILLGAVLMSPSAATRNDQLTAPAPWKLVDNPQGGDTAPTERYRAAGAYDEATHSVVLFGGGPAALSDTWTWDGAVWKNQTFKNGASNPSLSPPARYGAAMAYDPIEKKVVLFGGTNNSGKIFNDTWIWDGDWIQVKTAQSPPELPPASRSGAAMVYDEDIQKLVLFGGYSGAGKDLNDTWLWDSVNTRWVSSPSLTKPPLERSDAAMAYDAERKNIVVFGGINKDGAQLGDTWTWTTPSGGSGVAGGSWTPKDPSSDPTTSRTGDPSIRSATSIAFDPATKKVLMYGGQLPTNIAGCADQCPAATSDETWMWDGSWQNLTTTLDLPPSHRAYAMMAQNPDSKPTLMIFGGLSGISLRDTYLWDGSRLPVATTTTTSSSATSTSTTSTSTASTTKPPVTPLLPVIHQLTPASDSTTGGANVNISGARLAGATLVSFGDVRDRAQGAQQIDCSQAGACTGDDSHLVVKAPPHARGTVDVFVTTGAGRSAVTRDRAGNDDQFTYFPPPPPSGATVGGQLSGGFTEGQPGQPATPGGFGAAPTPGFGGAITANPGFAPAPTPGANGPAASPVAPAAGSSAAAGAAQAPVGAASAGPTAGLSPPGALSPVAPAAWPTQDSGFAGGATSYKMVRPAMTEQTMGAALAVGGVVLVLICCGVRRRPQAALAGTHGVAGRRRAAPQGVY